MAAGQPSSRRRCQAKQKSTLRDAATDAMGRGERKDRFGRKRDVAEACSPPSVFLAGEASCGQKRHADVNEHSAPGNITLTTPRADTYGVTI